MSDVPLSRELTPAQHTFIRQQIALIPVYVWVIYAWGVFFTNLPLGPRGDKAHVGRDFVHFYTQGVITREHNAHALYDIDAMAAVVDRVVPVAVEVRFPPVYGPQVGLLFAPLARVPYVTAMLTWLGLTILGYFGCVYLVWRTSPALRTRRWLTLVLALGAPGLHFTLSFGQASLVGLVCFTLMWLALRSGRAFLAGLAAGALAYKPQFGVVAAFVFVLAGEWRVVWGAVVAMAAQFAAAWAYWGYAIFPAYVRALARLPGVIDAMEPDKDLMHSLRSSLQLAGLPAGVSLVVSVALSAAIVAIAVLCWRTRGPLAPRYGVLVLATLLVNPHSYAYDLLLLAPALLVTWDWAHGPGCRTPSAVASLAAFVYVAPLLTIAVSAVPIQWSVVGFLVLGAALADQLLRRGHVNCLESAG